MVVTQLGNNGAVRGAGGTGNPRGNGIRHCVKCKMHLHAPRIRLIEASAPQRGMRQRRRTLHSTEFAPGRGWQTTSTTHACKPWLFSTTIVCFWSSNTGSSSAVSASSSPRGCDERSSACVSRMFSSSPPPPAASLPPSFSTSAAASKMPPPPPAPRASSFAALRLPWRAYRGELTLKGAGGAAQAPRTQR